MTRSVRALKWSYIGIAARVSIQLAAQIALARFIGPEGFGVVAAAVLFLHVANIVVELGFGNVLVRAQEVHLQDVRIAFTRIMVASLLVSGLIVTFAELVGAWFGHADVAHILQWMTLVIVAQAFGVVSLASLRRNLDFASIQLAQVSSYLVGFGLVGVTCAWLGFGAWSLVAAWVSQAIVASSIQYIKAPHPITPLMSRSATLESALGLRTTFANLCNLSVEYIDNFMIGRAYGAASLGAYSVAYNLLRTPLNHIVFSLQQVIYSFVARARDDHETVGKSYLAMVWAVTLVIAPTFMGVGFLASTVVEALYGNAWHEAAHVLLPLALAMPLQSLQAVGGPILHARDRVQTEIRISISSALLMVTILAAAAQFSLVAMAWGVWAVYLVRASWVTYEVSRLLGLPFLGSFKMLWGGLVVGTLTSLSLFLANDLGATLGVPPLVRLVSAVILGGMLLPAVAWATLPLILPQALHEQFSQVVAKLPERIRDVARARMHNAAPVGKC